jgi:hypothetical protein
MNCLPIGPLAPPVALIIDNMREVNRKGKVLETLSISSAFNPNSFAMTLESKIDLFNVSFHRSMLKKSGGPQTF